MEPLAQRLLIPAHRLAVKTDLAWAAQLLRHMPKLAPSATLRGLHRPFCAGSAALHDLRNAHGLFSPHCGACLLSRPPLDLCLTATAYAWPWVELIARFKFREQAGWDRPLADLMQRAPRVNEVLDRADWVLPIPLSAQRLSERGYNQAWLLARQLSPAKADAKLLIRTRDTPTQRSLPRAKRLANLKGAFSLTPGRAAQLAGKRVVLVDDVMTSGASLHTAARVLRQAGVLHISALVLSRTESHGPN